MRRVTPRAGQPGRARAAGRADGGDHGTEQQQCAEVGHEGQSQRGVIAVRTPGLDRRHQDRGQQHTRKRQRLIHRQNATQPGEEAGARGHAGKDDQASMGESNHVVR